MGWNLEEVEKFYDTYAHQYDNDTPDVEYPSSRLLSQWVRNYLTRFSHPIKILDVGCGTGKSSRLFFDEPLPDSEIYGVDGSRTMLEYARKYPFKELVHQDIEKPLLIDETFDGILCVGVLDFVNNITNMLQSFNKLLSPSGCLAITIPLTKNLDLNYVSEKDMHEMIAKVGFLILHQQEIFGYKDSETGEVTFYYGFLLQRSLT